MSEPVKKTFVIEWQGPYTLEGINEIKDKKNSGSMYMVSGLQRYQHGQSVVHTSGYQNAVPLSDFMIKGTRVNWSHVSANTG